MQKLTKSPISATSYTMHHTFVLPTRQMYFISIHSIFICTFNKFYLPRISHICWAFATSIHKCFAVVSERQRILFYMSSSAHLTNFSLIPIPRQFLNVNKITFRSQCFYSPTITRWGCSWLSLISNEIVRQNSGINKTECCGWKKGRRVWVVEILQENLLDLF